MLSTSFADTVNVLAVANAVVLPALYHLIDPRPLTTPASVIVCSIEPLNTCAVSTVLPVLFLNTLPLLHIIVTVIASAPASPFAPVAPCVLIIAGVK